MRGNELQADWSNWNDGERQQVKGLFGGNPRRARYLGGPWYYCVWTYGLPVG